MKINLKKLELMEEEGWLKSSTHPTLPLKIFNYTNKAQWEKHWNEYTLMCRGLVTDDEGNIVARCLPKFFNIGELEVIPSGDFKIYTKYDGSYIQVFKYKDKVVMSSRGSFISDQVSMAMGIWIDEEYKIPDIEEDLNYMFELIHEDNRIVVDYKGDRSLKLIAVQSKDGIELDVEDFCDEFDVTEEVFDMGSNWENIKEDIPDDEEGFVIHFKSGERMKLKGEEYCRLHRIVTETSSKDIWKMLRDDSDMTEIMERVPDEFINFFHRTVGELIVKFKMIEQKVERDWDYGIKSRYIRYDLISTGLMKGGQMLPYRDGFVAAPTRKEIAEYFNTCKYPKMMFLILDGKDYDDLIWENIKPKFTKAFMV